MCYIIVTRFLSNNNLKPMNEANELLYNKVLEKDNHQIILIQIIRKDFLHDLILSTYDIRKKYLFKLGDTCLCHIKLSSGILHNQFQPSYHRDTPFHIIHFCVGGLCLLNYSHLHTCVCIYVSSLHRNFNAAL